MSKNVVNESSLFWNNMMMEALTDISKMFEKSQCCPL